MRERFQDKRLLAALWEKCQQTGGFSLEEVLKAAREEPPETGDLRSDLGLTADGHVPYELPGAPNTSEVIVTLSVDQGPIAPHKDCDGMWTPYSFNTNHNNFKHPNDPYLLISQDGTSGYPGLKLKLDEGLAFVLGYYEHGQCRWFVTGEGPPGSDCPWDGVSVAGVLIWEHDADDMGAKTYEDRKKDAARFLEIYTDWCNGSVYCIAVKKDGEEVDGCCGIFDSELDYYMKEMVHPHTRGVDPDNVTVEGDANWLAQYHEVTPEIPATAGRGEPANVSRIPR